MEQLEECFCGRAAAPISRQGLSILHQLPASRKKVIQLLRPCEEGCLKFDLIATPLGSPQVVVQIADAVGHSLG